MKNIKFVICPDSFKESVSALNGAKAIKSGLEKAFINKDVNVTFELLPMADGGEGTMEVITRNLGGDMVTHMVSGPLGNKVNATYGFIESKNIAVIEVAEACGLHLVPIEKRNPLETTTFGVGELIVHAIKGGAKKLIIGLGGSSTSDCGVGMFNAMGAKFYNETEEIKPLSGKDLIFISKIDLTEVYSLLDGVEINVACDVENPLLGEYGANMIFGRQKGATEEIKEILESNMDSYVTILEGYLNKNIRDLKKGGAAGGLGAAFITLDGKLMSGIELVLNTINFESKVKDADYVITGEGSIDSQTTNGKTISGIAKICSKYNIPVIVLAGMVADDIDDIYDIGITAILGIVDGAKSLEAALKDGEKSIKKTAENLGRIITVRL